MPPFPPFGRSEPEPSNADLADVPERSHPAVWAVGVLAGLLVAVVGGGLWHLRSDTIEAQARALASLATASADELERGMQGVKLAMQVTRDELREGRIVPGTPETSAQLHTRTMILSRTRRLWVVDANGRVLASSSQTPPPRPADFLPSPQSLPDEGISFSVPFFDREQGQTDVAMAVRYGSRWRDDGVATPDERASGWVVAEIPSASLLGSFPRAALAADARMVVQRADGVVLAGSLQQSGGSLAEPAIDTRPNADAVQRLDDGTLRIVQVRQAPSLGLRLVMTRDLHAGLQNWRELAQGSAIALVVVLSGLGALLLRMLRAERGRRVLSVKLARVRKLESLGTLAGGVAHDFNNILAAVQGYSEMARQAAAEGSPQARHLDQVLQAARQGQAAVGRILGFSRAGAWPRTRVAVQPLVEQVLDLLAGTMDARIRVDRRIGPWPDSAGPAVMGDATQLFQAVMNLCTNALQAMQGQPGVLTVGLQQRHFSSQHWTSHGSLDAGDYVEISVTDTGVGIAPEVMDRLFEPFFTTRGREGTGLGLAVVHGVVEDFGGGVDVTSRPGRGSRFGLYLPIAPVDAVVGAGASPGVQAAESSSADAAQGAAQCPAAAGTGQVVMVVDDEEALVTLGEELLAGLGYEPVGFTDPERALAAFRAEPDRFDVLMTDERMPRLSGTQLTQQVHALRPGLPVVLVSGWGGPQLTQRAAALGIAQVLAKPIDAGALAQALALAIRASTNTRHS